MQEFAETSYKVVEEKWSIYPKDTARYIAIDENRTEIAKSEKFIIEGFNLIGPNEKNPKHKEIFEKFMKKLTEDGWQVYEPGSTWFNQKLRKA